MAESAWEKLRGPTYKIYRVSGNWFSRLVLERYLIVAPGGRSVGTTLTLRGARRKLGRDQREDHPPWWEEPIVEEVPRG